MYCVPETVPGTGETTVNETDRIPALTVYMLVGVETGRVVLWMDPDIPSLTWRRESPSVLLKWNRV